MRSYTAVIERDPDTGLLVGHVPGWAGAHSQGETLEELRENLREAVTMLAEVDWPASTLSERRPEGERWIPGRSSEVSAELFDESECDLLKGGGVPKEEEGRQSFAVDLLLLEDGNDLSR